MIATDGKVMLWDPVEGTHRRTMCGHEGGISTISWSPDSRYLCSASDDMTLKLWDVTSGTEVRTFHGHRNIVFAVDYSPHGDLIVSGSFDCTIRIWSVQDGRCLLTIPGHMDPITSVNFNRDASLVVSGSFDGLVRIWDCKTGHCIRTILQNQNSPVSSATFSPNGKFVLIGTFGGTLQLWNYAQEKVLKRYRGHLHERYCVQAGFAVHQGAAAIMSGSEDGHVYLWDLQTKRVSLRLAGHQGPVVAVDSHPTLPIVVSGELSPNSPNEPGVIRLWQPPEQIQQSEQTQPLSNTTTHDPIVIHAQP